jgi:hypothetical protein
MCILILVFRGIKVSLYPYLSITPLKRVRGVEVKLRAFIYGLSKDPVSSSGENVEWQDGSDWKGCGRKRPWSDLMYYPVICLAEQNTTKNFSQDSQSPGRSKALSILNRGIN